MEEYKWERVSDPADPERCQAVTSAGQCMNKSVEGTHNCPCHGGRSTALLHEKEQLRTYRLKKYQSRLNDFAESDKIKSLRDEIGILRILVEERFNQCNTELDLMLHSSSLADLVMKVEKLVSSCNRLEGQLGAMLDKTQALQLGTEMVEIVGRHVESEEALQAIADEIIETINRLGKPKSAG